MIISEKNPLQRMCWGGIVKCQNKSKYLEYVSSSNRSRCYRRKDLIIQGMYRCWHRTHSTIYGQGSVVGPLAPTCLNWPNATSDACAVLRAPHSQRYQPISERDEGLSQRNHSVTSYTSAHIARSSYSSSALQYKSIATDLMSLKTSNLTHT